MWRSSTTNQSAGKQASRWLLCGVVLISSVMTRPLRHSLGQLVIASLFELFSHGHLHVAIAIATLIINDVSIIIIIVEVAMVIKIIEHEILAREGW